MAEGREGDWECGGCGNRNYAFRSLCNRCKQPRLLVDTKTPADSKWLPRIGDWICSGCSNNNYASREKCKKCGQPKEESAMPAIAMHGTLPTYSHYFARVQELPGLKMNYGMLGNSALQHSLVPRPNWSTVGPDNYRFHATPTWPFSGSSSTGLPYAGNMNQVPVVPKGWRNGDWICNCGFHNYSSREQCKKCNAPLPARGPSSAVSSAVSDMFPTLGTKRLASEEFVNDWDNKRLNAGDVNHQFLTNSQPNAYRGFEQLARSSNDHALGMHSKYGSSGTVSSIQVNMEAQQLATMPAIIGKGAKQWREGDWMCSNCNNHNYASRSHCNRCKTQKEAVTLPVSVP